MWRADKKIIHSIAICLAAILFLGGCQNAVQEPGENDSQLYAVAREEGGPMEEYVIPNWREAICDEMGEVSVTVQGQPLLYRDGVWQLVLARGENGLEVYQQMFSFETKEWSLSPVVEDIEIGGTTYRGTGNLVSSMDGSLCSLLLREEGESRFYRPARFGPDGIGEPLSEEDYPAPQMLEEKYMDYSGNFISYRNNGERRDQNGEYFADVSFYNEELEKQGEQRILGGWVLGILQADGQSPVRMYGYDEDRTPTLWGTGGEKQLLKGIEEVNYQAVYAQDGSLCITGMKSLWAVDNSEVRELYYYPDHGYYPDAVYGICRGEGQTLQILMECDGELLLLTYDLARQDEVADKQEITIAFSIPNYNMERVIARFNRQSNRYYVKVIWPEQLEDVQTFVTRVQMELAAGRGPDMWGDDVFSDHNALVRSGYAECLDGQGFEKLGCIETAFEACKIDQKLYGIPYDFSLDFAAYRAADMGEDALTVKKLMEKVRGSQARILQRLLFGSQIVLKYALSDASNKDYIDWEAGKSHLTEEPFLEVLEFAREYAEAADGAGHSLSDSLEANEIFASSPWIAGTGMRNIEGGFRDIYADLGRDIKMQGYPRKDGYGIYLVPRVLYINSQSDGKEGAMAFLQYLLSEDAQTKYIEDYSRDDYYNSVNSVGISWRSSAYFPVNRAVLETLMDREFGEKPDDQWIEESYRSPSYTDIQREQFTFLIENAQPSLDLGELSGIVQEELAPFFDGSRTAQEAARILDSRVQLYLDERK